MERATKHPASLRGMVWAIVLGALLPLDLAAREFHVGPEQEFARIGDVPWAKLEAGDRVLIHWRREPYREKWVINRQGTADQPILVSGIRGPSGERPVIDGRDAKTAPNLDYWNEARGLIKIGGSSIPADGTPTYIILEGLEIRSAHPDYVFYDRRGRKQSYRSHAAGIHVERAANLIIRDCVLHDCGNGLFVGASNGRTQRIIIERNHIHGNGIVGRFYEHNTYTAAVGIIYQFNRFGPLRDGAGGNNIKDRSAGLVVRYNWIEGGNRLLDAVDAEDSKKLVDHPSYRRTYVYGNLLIERDGGNSQVIHYGGDSGKKQDYRKGTLYFYNNTLYSTRAGNTTLISLSTNDESAKLWNNILYVTAQGNHLAIVSAAGRASLRHNWLKSGWRTSHEGSAFTGSVQDDGTNITGVKPGFIDKERLDLRLAKGSPAIDAGSAFPDTLPQRHRVVNEYERHQQGRKRLTKGNIDLGAFEYDHGGR